MRQDRKAFYSSVFAPIAFDEKSITWWTWAGGNINNTLRTVFLIEFAAEAQASNEYVKVKNGNKILTRMKETITRMSDPSYWENPDLLRNIHAMVPNYHLSKFQPYLPEPLKLKLVADTIFDIEGTLGFLEKNMSVSIPITIAHEKS